MTNTRVSFALGLLALGLLLTACGPPSDAKVRQRLAGIWYVEITNSDGSTFKSVTIVAPDGRYTSHAAATQPASKAARVGRLEGTFRIQDGFLIDTITKNTQPNAIVPRTLRARIVRATDRELAVKYEGATGVSIFRKDEPPKLDITPMK